MEIYVKESKEKYEERKHDEDDDKKEVKELHLPISRP